MQETPYFSNGCESNYIYACTVKPHEILEVKKKPHWLKSVHRVTENTICSPVHTSFRWTTRLTRGTLLENSHSDLQQTQFRNVAADRRSHTGWRVAQYLLVTDSNVSSRHRYERIPTNYMRIETKRATKWQLHVSKEEVKLHAFFTCGVRSR